MHIYVVGTNYNTINTYSEKYIRSVCLLFLTGFLSICSLVSRRRAAIPLPGAATEDDSERLPQTTHPSEYGHRK